MKRYSANIVDTLLGIIVVGIVIYITLGNL